MFSKALSTYQLSTLSGDVYLDEVSNSDPTPPIIPNGKHILIIGGGVTGLTFVPLGILHLL